MGRDRIRLAADTGIHTHIVAPLSDDATDIARTFAAFTPENYPR